MTGRVNVACSRSTSRALPSSSDAAACSGMKLMLTAAPALRPFLNNDRRLAVTHCCSEDLSCASVEMQGRSPAFIPVGSKYASHDRSSPPPPVVASSVLPCRRKLARIASAPIARRWVKVEPVCRPIYNSPYWGPGDGFTNCIHSIHELEYPSS